MPGTRCTASIVAVSFCEAHELARQDFEACLLSFPEIHARIKVLAEQRASKSKLASEDEKKARVRRAIPATECVSDEGSDAPAERVGTFRHAFKGSILKTIAVKGSGHRLLIRFSPRVAAPPPHRSPAPRPAHNSDGS